MDIATLAREEGLDDSWTARVGRLDFLAPYIVEAIPNGEQPTHLTVNFLPLINPLPEAWINQL